MTFQEGQRSPLMTRETYDAEMRASSATMPSRVLLEQPADPAGDREAPFLHEDQGALGPMFSGRTVLALAGNLGCAALAGLADLLSLQPPRLLVRALLGDHTQRSGKVVPQHAGDPAVFDRLQLFRPPIQSGSTTMWAGGTPGKGGGLRNSPLISTSCTTRWTFATVTPRYSRNVGVAWSSSDSLGRTATQ